MLLTMGAASAAYAVWRRTSRLEVRRMQEGGLSTYLGGRYCGPGWGFSRQDVESGKILTLPDALDAIDEACKHHDQCYTDHGYFSRRCNRRLAAELMGVVLSSASSAQQRVDAVVMAAVFAVEAEKVDPWLRPASDLIGAVHARTRDAIDAAFQKAATMYHAMESVIYQLYGVPR